MDSLVLFISSSFAADIAGFAFAETWALPYAVLGYCLALCGVRDGLWPSSDSFWVYAVMPLCG
jgi:hypothetical protein